MVTHDPQMASYCNRLILLNDEVTLEALKSSGEQEALYESWEEKILIKQAGIAEGEQIGRSKEKTEFVKKLYFVQILILDKFNNMVSPDNIFFLFQFYIQNFLCPMKYNKILE